MKRVSRFELYELVRDATTVNGAQRALLDSLAWRANPEKSFTCFPSYDRLVEDTHYTEQNLRVAARKLEGAGFIKRVKRPHPRGLGG